MAAGIRTTNLPTGALLEVLGHAVAGDGKTVTARMPLSLFVDMLRGMASADPTGLAGIIKSIQDLAGDLPNRATTASVTQLREELAAKAEQDDLDALSRRLGSLADRGSLEVLGGRIDAANAARVAGDTEALVAVLRGNEPGRSPAAFSALATGSTADLAPLDPDGRVATALGSAYELRGPALIAPRGAVLVDPDAIWVLRATYWRLIDELDPNNSAVDVGIQWLDASDADAGRTLVHRESNLMVQDGPRTLAIRVPSLSDTSPVIAAPRGAVSWRPYVRTYGVQGATAVAMLGATEATFAGVFAPDLSALVARLSTIEAQIDAGLPLSAPILPSYAVADLPRPGNPGRKAFARDGRAPNAAGALEAANAGTGVEVVDNGTRWVISGTNQAVQA